MLQFKYITLHKQINLLVMKHKGTGNVYITQRNKDLYEKYKDVIKFSEIITSKEIFRRLVSMPAKRFYVSEDRASVIIRKMMKGEEVGNMKKETKKMYHDMFNLVTKILNSDKTSTMSKAISKVLNGDAPYFYLTENSARVIISRIKNKKYQVT